MLLHAHPGYTTNETRSEPYTLLVSLDGNGEAFGTAYIDDGESNPDSSGFIANRTITFSAANNTLKWAVVGDFGVEQPIESVTVLGVGSSATNVSIAGAEAGYDADVQRLNVTKVALQLNADGELNWM